MSAMLLIGIDEAGYGPVLGPLCHGYSAIRCPDAKPPHPPDLWELLHPSVMRFPGVDGSVVVDDSKIVHGAPDGKELLRRGVLAFLECCNENPLCLDADVYALILPDHDRARLEEDAWCAALCAALESQESPEIPESPKPQRSSRKISSRKKPAKPIPAVRESLARQQMSVVALGARGLSARHFNAAMANCKNKADVNWSVIAEQLSKLLAHALPGEHVHVVIDRQGGRKFYAEKIGELFPGAMVWVEQESDAASVYGLDWDGRTLRIAFKVDADGQSLPVALGSMAAKLAREICMKRLNQYFQSHDPELRPTAGYYADGNRFLKDTRGLRKKLGIHDHVFIRVK